MDRLTYFRMAAQSEKVNPQPFRNWSTTPTSTVAHEVRVAMYWTYPLARPDRSAIESSVAGMRFLPGSRATIRITHGGNSSRVERRDGVFTPPPPS
jgi:hypothetical protein